MALRKLSDIAMHRCTSGLPVPTGRMDIASEIQIQYLATATSIWDMKRVQQDAGNPAVKRMIPQCTASQLTTAQQRSMHDASHYHFSVYTQLVAPWKPDSSSISDGNYNWVCVCRCCASLRWLWPSSCRWGHRQWACRHAGG